MPTYPVTSGTVPANLECIIANDKWQELVALLAVVLAAGSNFTVSATEPGPTERSNPWIKLNSDGTPDDLYIYAGGVWIAKHRMAVGSVIMYEGSLGSIDTFDGGEVGAVSATTGPFWERVTQMDARFPIGPGTLPSTLVLAVGDQDGEEDHALALTEITPHTHGVEGSGFNDGSLQPTRRIVIDDEHLNNSNNSVTESAGGTGSPAAVVAHNNMPPYNAIWFIRRTARVYRRG